MPQNNSKARRDTRRRQAEERDAQHATRSSAEQVALLDERLGKGQGAHKERLLLEWAELDK
jgi:hypothetical protein